MSFYSLSFYLPCSFWYLNTFDPSVILFCLTPGVSSLSVRLSLLFPPQIPFSPAASFSTVDPPPFSFLMCLLFPVVLGSNFYCWILGLSPLFFPFHLRWAGTNLQVECREKITQYCGEIFSIMYKYQFAIYILYEASLKILTQCNFSCRCAP